MRGFRFRSSVYSDSCENSVPVVNIVDDVNIFQKQTTMSKIGSSGINDSDGSKTIEECRNLKLLYWFIVLRQRSHIRPGNGARVQYSLGTNVNALFSSTVPNLELRHSVGTRAQKWTMGSCV